jgi:hypothetical protein
MKRRSFLKSLCLTVVTAAISTELAFKAFVPEEENSLMKTIREILLKPSDVKGKTIELFTGEAGMKEFNKAMREYHG